MLGTDLMFNSRWCDNVYPTELYKIDIGGKINKTVHKILRPTLTEPLTQMTLFAPCSPVYYEFHVSTQLTCLFVAMRLQSSYAAFLRWLYFWGRQLTGIVIWNTQGSVWQEARSTKHHAWYVDANKDKVTFDLNMNLTKGSLFLTAITKPTTINHIKRLT